MLQPMSGYARLFTFVAATGAAGFLHACKTGNNSAIKAADAAAATTGRGEQCGSLSPKEGYTIPAGLTPAPNATCEQLHLRFGSKFSDDNPEDLRVICPFLRIVNRSKEWATETQKFLIAAKMNLILPVPLTSVAGKTREFGCDGGACTLIATVAGKDQFLAQVVPPLVVDIGQLSRAVGSAHDCGYNFSHGDHAVNPDIRAATLSRFKELADKDGHLSYADLVTVKKERCKADYAQFSTVEGNKFRNQVNDAKDSLLPDDHDQTEAALIYSYTGGPDRGYITYSDLEQLFTAQIPSHRSAYLLDGTILNYSKAIGLTMGFAEK